MNNLYEEPGNPGKEEWYKKEAEKGDKEHLLDLRLEILQEIDPFLSKASELQLYHLEHNRQVMEKYMEKI